MKRFDLIKSQVVDFLKANEKGTASELRQDTGTVRRILMPILELLDEQGVPRMGTNVI